MAAEKPSDMTSSPPPWAGFWFEVANFFRRHSVLLFAFVWFAPIPVAIVSGYIKLTYLLIAFALDKRAVQRAEDTHINTLTSMRQQLESALNQTEDITHQQEATRDLWAWIAGLSISAIIALHFILSIMYPPNDMGLTIIFSLVYGTWGMLSLFLLSAHIRVSGKFFVKAVMQERLNDPCLWNEGNLGCLGVLSQRWLLFALELPLLMGVAAENFAVYGALSDNSIATIPFRFLGALVLTMLSTGLFLRLMMNMKGSAYVNVIKEHASKNQRIA